MADYVSTLTGPQMDAALLDMAEHNSEAYAVGERNGIAVASDDVTYHNNARYYAQIASSQIVGDASSAVRWDTDQSEVLTDAQKAQARENIGATAFNDNLLDNGWFTVRQRGDGPFGAGAGYTVDRWKTTNARSILTGYSDYVTLSMSTSGNGFLRQYLATPYSGTYTFSAYVRGSGSGYIAVNANDSGLTVLASKSFSNVGNAWTLVSGTFTTSGTPISIFSFRADDGTSIDIKCAKLELGSVSTLANDAPPEYGEELTRCIYSTADPTDTCANNGFGRTNPNLLDNWDFYNPVNQRGLTTYNSSASTYYTLDRWKLYNGSGSNYLAVMGGYIRLKSGNNGFVQYIDAQKAAELNGKTITLSVKFLDGTISTWTTVFSTSSLAGKGIDKGCSLYCGLESSKYVLFDILTRSNDYVDIVSVKTELGSVSTLANDAPPDYGTELAKCQRYFVRIANTSGVSMPIGYAVKNSSTNVWVNVATPVELRAVPTTTFSGTHRVFGGGASSRDISSYSTYGKNAQGVLLLATISSGSIADNEVFVVYAASGAYVDFSAEL